MKAAEDKLSKKQEWEFWNNKGFFYRSNRRENVKTAQAVFGNIREVKERNVGDFMRLALGHLFLAFFKVDEREFFSTDPPRLSRTKVARSVGDIFNLVYEEGLFPASAIP